MRNEKELLELILDNIGDLFETGICIVVCDLYWGNSISNKELNKILDYLNNNLPEKKI